MNDAAAEPIGPDSGEAALREALVRGDVAVASVGPVLRHLLVSDDHALFGEDVVARVRGMLGDLARQLWQAVLLAGEGAAAPAALADDPVAALSASLPEIPGLLTHLHALALEWQVTERLAQVLALDPVRAPLVQALVGSDDGETGAAAIRLLAAQARFAQSQRRMQLPLGELPGELLHGALVALHAYCAYSPGPGEALAEAADRAIRGRYNEGTSRLALLARLVADMGAGARAALSVSHAGVAIFGSALAQASGQSRELCVVSLAEGQSPRLGLALCAAGLRAGEVQACLLALGAPAAMTQHIAALGSERAAAILASSRLQGGR